MPTFLYSSAWNCEAQTDQHAGTEEDMHSVEGSFVCMETSTRETKTQTAKTCKMDRMKKMQGSENDKEE